MNYGQRFQLSTYNYQLLLTIFFKTNKNILVKASKFKSYSLIFILFLVSILRGVAQPPVPPRPVPAQAVNDFAGLMQPSERQILERKIRAFHDSTSNQIVVLTVPSLKDYPIEDWALEVGRQWGVGRKQKNNGVVIIVSVEPRKGYIATGYGLEGALPDITCKRIYQNQMVPRFKESRFFDGFDAAVDAIKAATKGEYVNEDKQSGGDSGSAVWGFIIILVIFLIIFLIIRRISRRMRGNYGTRRRDYHQPDIWWGGFPMGGGGFGGGGDFGGGGNSDSGGGFDFGGGDFGGGGAGGDW